MAGVSVGSPAVRAEIGYVRLLLTPLLAWLTVFATFLAGLAGLTVLLSPAAAAAPIEAQISAHSSGQDPTTGLEVSIETLSPTSLEPGDVVEVSGTVTNVDDHPWLAINAFLVNSAGALTSAQELQDAADSPDTSYIGDRVIEPDAFVGIGDLDPGESVDYALQVPYRDLGITGAPGVYQIGVQVIGTDVDGSRSLSATGRARTFLPLLSADGARVQTSLLWPLLAPVRRVAGGRLGNGDRLVALCAPGGRLRTLLDMARSSGPVPLTLVLDPGLLDALGEIARGTTSSPLAEQDGAAGTPSFGTPSFDTPSPGASGSTAGTPDQVPGAGALAEFVQTEPVDESADQRTARLWLRDLVAFTPDVSVWATGYDQPDLAALPTRESPDVSIEPLTVRTADRLRAATNRATTATLSSLNISATSLWWPPGGYTDTAALTRASPTVRASIVGAGSLPGRPETGSSLLQVDTAGGVADVVVNDPTYLDGGPGPGDTDSALQVRQRIAAETALQSLALTAQGRRFGGATVVLSRFWDPGAQWGQAAFFTAFSTSWTRMATTQEQLDRPLVTYEGAAAVPPSAGPPPLPAELTRAAALIDRRSGLLGELLRGPAVTDSVTLFYDEVTTTALSQYWRARPGRGQAYARRSARALAGQLQSVSVEIPTFVTLSSQSGRFGITITNRLDQAVTVGVDFDSGSGRFTLPDVAPIAIGPGERRTILVSASVTDVAVDQVTAHLTTVSGDHFGPAATFTLRTSVLGVVIWIALGAGAGFVLLVVLRRSVRRVRTGRATR